MITYTVVELPSGWAVVALDARDRFDYVVDSGLSFDNATSRAVEMNAAMEVGRRA